MLAVDPEFHNLIQKGVKENVNVLDSLGYDRSNDEDQWQRQEDEDASTVFLEEVNG